MNKLERDFIRHSTNDLKKLSEDLQNLQTGNFSENFLGEAFRLLHRIKGTAQAFGFAQTGELAHLLENLVSAAKNEKTDADSFAEAKSALTQGAALLIESFDRRKDFSIPEAFAEKLGRVRADTDTAGHDFSGHFPDAIPDFILTRLSARETSEMQAALEHGSDFFVLEKHFDRAAFAAGFKEFRNDLSARGRIIAVFPSPARAEKIGFQLIFVSNRSDEIKSFAARTNAQIVYEKIGEAADSLAGVLAKIVEHGKKTGRMLGKEIDFVVSADDSELPPETLKLIFDILLQLVRNAVSHAFDERGRVSISIRNSTENCVLKIDDDGNGIDHEKIKTKALEKNTHRRHDVEIDENSSVFTENEALKLTFLPEISTAETLTAISGRGIGLDIVKKLVAGAGGRIAVESTRNKGTTFEISLPKEKI